MSAEPAGIDVELLLRRALAPVEPPDPDDLLASFEVALAGINQAAQDELASWEIEAMADPRNWVRPAVAVAAGTLAGAGLVVLRVQATRRRRRAQSSDALDYAARTARAVGAETKRLLRE
jgi:hypothetical protein